MSKLTQAVGIDGFYDSSRVESVLIRDYISLSSAQRRREVVMIMQSGSTHTWKYEIEAEAEKTQRSLLAAVKESDLAYPR